MNKNKLIKLSSSIALGAALLTGVVACSNNSNDSAKTSQTSKKETKKSSSTASKSSKKTDTTSSASKSKKAVKEATIKTDVNKIKLSQQEALDKFDGQFKGKKVKSIDLKLEGNQYVYEIDAIDSTHEYTAEINAETGQVSRAHSEKLDLDDRNEKTLDLNNVISRDEASKIAEKHVKGTSQEWNLEQEGNTAYWDVEVSDGTKLTEVKINAHTKQIVAANHDNDND